jgi:hypothetical protein
MSQPGLPLPSAQEIQRVTAEVLRRPEFAPARETGRQPLRWPGPARFLEPGPAGTVILKILLFLLVTALVVHLVRLLLSASGGPALFRRAERLKAAALREHALSGEEPEVLLRRAEEALAQGDLRSAIRLVYWIFIDRLAAAGLLARARWKTSLAYLGECPLHAEQYPLLQELTGAYNTIVYGHSPCEKEKIAGYISELRNGGGRK